MERRCEKAYQEKRFKKLLQGPAQYPHNFAEFSVAPDTTGDPFSRLKTVGTVAGSIVVALGTALVYLAPTFNLLPIDVWFYVLLIVMAELTLLGTVFSIMALTHAMPWQQRGYSYSRYINDNSHSMQLSVPINGVERHRNRCKEKKL